MGNITLGQIGIFLAAVAGVIVSVSTITGVGIKLSKAIRKNRKEKEINPVLDEIKNMESRITAKMEKNNSVINAKIDTLANDIRTLDINQCKDVIVDYLTDIENGNNVPSKEERAYEAYDRYTTVFNQNSYIHKRWDKVINKIKE